MIDNLDLERLQIKLEIAEAACHYYIQNDGSFTFREVAGETDMDPAEIFNYFSTKQDILEFYYTSLVIKYQLMIEEIEDFETYTISEKLSNFIYASFDMMKEQKAFVEATFRPIIMDSFNRTDYEEHIEKLFKTFFRNDPQISLSSTLVLRPLFFRLMVKKYLSIVNFWLNDESEGQELAMEFVDKLTAFIQEVMYNSVVDKGVELIKFLTTNNIVTQHIPFWDKISSKIEIR